MKPISSLRDILLFDADPAGVLVSAVDSCGGIGSLPGDSLHTDPVIVGQLTARVALMEVLATGARPLFASAAVSSGPQTAVRLIEGIKKTLGSALPLNISTEKNMSTPMTALGITVTGLCAPAGLRVAGAQKGDVLYCASRPSVGAQTLKEDALLFSERHLSALLDDQNVHSLLPVGSRGVAAEAQTLAAESGLSCTFVSNPEIDLFQSAGPATCAVFAARRPVRVNIGLPIFEIGSLT